MSAGAKAAAVAPASARVELPDQIQQPGSGGIELSGQLGDLVTEALELGRSADGGRNHGRETDIIERGVHRRSPVCSAPTLYRDFRRPPAPPERTIAAR